MSYPPPQEPQDARPPWHGNYGPYSQPNHQAPFPPYMTASPLHAPPAAPTKRKKMPFVVAGVAAVFLLCAGGTMGALFTDNGRQDVARGYANAKVSEQSHSASSPVASAPKAPHSPTASAAGATPPRPAATTPRPVTTTQAAVATIAVPKGVGLNYQAAQDLWRAAGLHVMPAHDATGANRLPIIDSNWVVVAQDLKAGARVPADSFITATVKKYTDD